MCRRRSKLIPVRKSSVKSRWKLQHSDLSFFIRRSRSILASFLASSFALVFDIFELITHAARPRISLGVFDIDTKPAILLFSLGK